MRPVVVGALVHGEYVLSIFSYELVRENVPYVKIAFLNDLE